MTSLAIALLMTADDHLDHVLHEVALHRAAARATNDERAIAAELDARTQKMLATDSAAPLRASPPRVARRVSIWARFVRFVLGLFGKHPPALPEPPRPRRPTVMLAKTVVTRDAAWVEAFRAQATRALFERAMRYAISRARQVEVASGRVDDGYAAELVQAALADTYVGRLRWSPDVPLEQHLIAAIKSRSRHDRERARRFDAIDDTLPEAARWATLLELADTSTKSVAALRRIAARKRDDEVLAILDAYAADAFDKDDVIAATGLTPNAYRGAKDRLSDYVDRLPEELRPARRRA
jgi:hypothetical protein